MYSSLIDEKALYAKDQAEQKLKQMNAEKSYGHVGIAGDAAAPTDQCCAGDKNVCEKPARSPLSEQLGRSGLRSDQQARLRFRALDILTRHPEFEEFLELQELISTGLFY
jgi:hypothetical protein